MSPMPLCASSWPKSQLLIPVSASDSLIVAQLNVGRFPSDSMEMHWRVKSSHALFF